MHDIAHALHKEIGAAAAIKESLKALTDDVDALRDTLEGETNLDVLIELALDEIDEIDTLLPGIDKRVEKLQARKTRLSGKKETLRAAILQAMCIAERKNLRLASGTISVGDKAKGIVVTDEPKIPSQFWVKPAPRLDKIELGKVLRVREKARLTAMAIKEDAAREIALAEWAQQFPPIPGAELDEGGQALTISRS